MDTAEISAFQWPHGAQCALMLSFDFDAETLWTSRDPGNERRLAIRSLGTFGAKVGVPKILQLLRDQELQGTFFVPGRVAERHTIRVEEILRDGHEIGHHGYDHLWADPDHPEIAEQEVDKGLKALQQTVGIVPAGYRPPGGEVTEDLLRLLTERGLLYNSTFKDDIIPYRHKLANGMDGVIELPGNPSLDDCAYGLSSLRTPRPLFPKDHVLAIWQEEFRETYDWGGLFVLVMHPQVTGRPMRLAILRDFIEYTRTFSGVWYATGTQIARAWQECEEATTNAAQSSRVYDVS